MWISRYTGATLTAVLLSVPLVRTQLSLDPCISKCIDQSTDDSCSLTDIKCICRESNGNFLPDLVLCMHGACDPNLDVTALLTPLSLACDFAGTPISQSALDNAEQEASSLAMITTVTVTQTGTNVAPSPVGPATAPASASMGQTVVTVTAPAAPTVTETSPGTTVYSLIPVVIVGTDSAGSVYTSTTSESGAITSITTTDSTGSTQTVVSTYTLSGTGAAGGVLTTTDSAGSTYTTTSASAAASASGSSASGAATSVSGESTTGTFVTSTTSTSNPETTNSSPFQQQGVAGHERVGSVFGLVVLLMVVGICS